MQYTITEAPQPLTQRQRHRKGYGKRPWNFYDGEGVTDIFGVHRYVLFGVISSTDGKLHSIHDEHGLATAKIFDFILAHVEKYPRHINVIFGASYDINMWLFNNGNHIERNRPYLERLYKGVPVWIQDQYQMKWTVGKSFHLKSQQTGIGVTVYDVMPFFQTTFVKACDSYLGEDYPDRQLIVAEKENRSTFKIEELETITRYMTAELITGIRLMEELRTRLYAVDLYPQRWDGPGAVASYLLKREKVKRAMTTCPDAVQDAARYAYAGGRFEVIRFGHVLEKAWEYDINSAYPRALLNVPDLRDGEWKSRKVRWNKNEQLTVLQAFSLVHITWKLTDANIPGPLFRRGKNGSVSYPMQGAGWYWYPEYLAATQYVRQYGGSIKVDEVHEYFPRNPTNKPFAFIQALYHERQALKHAGNGAHVGIKLGLNSMYGKTAQQVGWQIDNKGVLKIPPFHQIEWAGYITAWCRAQVLTAGMKVGLENVIAFETDALFVKKEIPQLSVGEGLGEWELTEFRNLTYLQSGIYFGDSDTSKKDARKTRGVDRGKLTREECLKVMAQPDAEKRRVEVKLNRFTTLGISLIQGKEKWCSWVELPKKITLEPTGKRIHDPACPCLADGLEAYVWHLTICPHLGDEHSKAFPIEWSNPDSEMTELSELRREGLAFE